MSVVYEEAPLLTDSNEIEKNQTENQDFNGSSKVHNNPLYNFVSIAFDINISKEKDWYFSRWQSFAGVCLLVSISGSTYAFGVYSQLLKSNLGFSQTDLDIVASIGNTGLYLSLLGGFLLENFGLQFVVMLGGLLIFIGFLYIFLAVSEIVPANVTSIGFFYFLSQFGVCCHVSSAVTTCIRLFPYESRGSAVGLGKGYFALSSAVLGDFSGGYFYYSPKMFLLFVAIFTPIVGSIGSNLSNFLPDHIATDFSYEILHNIPTYLTPFYIHWSILFIILFLDGYIEYKYDLSSDITSFLATILGITVIAILYIPHFYGTLYILMGSDNLSKELPYGSNNANNSKIDILNKAEIQKKRLSSSEVINSNKYTDFNNLLENNNVTDSEDDGQYNSRKVVYQDCYYGKSMSLLKVLKTWRFWALYVIYMTITVAICIGTGLMVIYNINAITESFSIYPSSFFVALISLANGLGRVLAGLSSDYLMKYLSKLQIMSSICLLMSLTQMGFLLVPIFPNILYISLLLTGFLFGSIVATIAVNIADIFGSKYIATNFGAIDSAPIFGSYIYATFIVSVFYQANVFDDAGSTCVGANCFKYTFLICCIACLAASLGCYITHLYTFIPYREGSSAH